MPAVSLAAPPAPRHRTELNALQGAWITAAGPRDCRLLVAGTRFALEFRDGDIYMGTFTVDADDDPRRMDMRIEEGPARHRGLTAYCIYQFDGGVLRWCPGRPGSATRLVRFPGVDDARYLSLVFRPVRPARGG
jgi:uncharacterized protein (TIGR03067 family)